MTASSPTATPSHAATLLGAGRIIEALLSGLAHTGQLQPESLVATARRPERADELFTRYGLRALTDNRAAVQGAELVVLAVRHPQLVAVLDEVAPALQPGQCVVSLAAGVPLSQVERRLPGFVPVVRALPNTPMAVGAGVIAVAPGSRASLEDVARVEGFFSPVGKVVRVEEPQLDAVNALSGAGPAYAYLMVEALAAAARREGLPADLAHTLASDTLLGAAHMVTMSGLTPSALIAQVAGPGGATAAALSQLEALGVREAFGAAVQAAARNTRERARRLGEDTGG
jgi:pyrroline-5-carboxylate reductase